MDITLDSTYFTKRLLLWLISFVIGFLLVFIPLYIPLHKAKVENSGKKLYLIGVFVTFSIIGGLITLFIADTSMADYFFT